MDQASFSLDSLPPTDSACPHCGKSKHSASHGYLYEQVSIEYAYKNITRQFMTILPRVLLIAFTLSYSNVTQLKITRSIYVFSFNDFIHDELFGRL